MRWDSGSWASPRARHGAGNIEIAQTSVTETVYSIHPVEHFFHQQLGFAVGIGGVKSRVFRDRGYVGFAINGGGGRKDKPVQARDNHGFQKA